MDGSEWRGLTGLALQIREAGMERSTKMVLLLALLLATFIVGLESRKLQKEAEPYQPQNLHRAHGGLWALLRWGSCRWFWRAISWLSPRLRERTGGARGQRRSRRCTMMDAMAYTAEDFDLVTLLWRAEERL